jgi:hypothetical protein
MPRPARPSLAFITGAVLVASACSSDSVSGPPPAPATIRAIAGNNQQGVVGQTLTNPLAVTVLDEKGRALANARVTFSASPGSGTLAPATVQTNSDGRAETRWTLGTQTGTSVVTASAGSVNPITFSATALPGPAARVVSSPSTVSLGVGDTLRMQASVRDQFGNAVSQTALNWSSLDPATASVTNGLVTARAIGSTRIVVSTTASNASIADTVPVSVGPAGSGFCGTREAVVPAVGAVVFLDSTSQSAERCIGSTIAGAEFALVAVNTASSFGTVAALDALALGVSTPTAIAAAFMSQMPTNNPISAAPTLATDGGFEAALRLRERRELPEHVTAARERFGAQARTTTYSTGTLIAAQTVPPAVGSFLTLNAQAFSACQQPNNRTGRVVAVSERAIIVADTANPSGGYTDQEYRDIAAAFDSVTYPLATEYFGDPTNLNGTGKITLFYTRAVNDLTPRNADYVVGGFFFARDLYPKTARNNLPACTNSNERELMYLLVADPSGQVNGNTRSKNDVTRLNRTTVIHELQHLINAGRRLLVTPSAVTSEEVWLDEGLAHTAEELLYFRLAGVGSRDNLNIDVVRRNTELFSSYAIQNFGRTNSYLRATESQSPYAPNDSLSTRGAAWHFMRYAAGRLPSDEPAFYRKLATGPRAGLANLTEAIPGGALSSWLRDWGIAMFADDLAPNLSAVYSIPSWNFRSIFPALTIGGQTLGRYPLTTRTLAAGTPVRFTLAGGGVSHMRFTVGAAQRALVSVSTNGRAPGDNVQLAIVRYR